MAGSRATVGEPHNTRPDLLLHGEPTNVRVSYFERVSCPIASSTWKRASFSCLEAPTRPPLQGGRGGFAPMNYSS